MDVNSKMIKDMAKMAEALEKVIPKDLNKFKKELKLDPTNSEMFTDALKHVNFFGNLNELDKVKKDCDNFIKKYNASHGK